MLSNKVSEIMTTNIVTAPTSSTAYQVMEKMIAEDIGRIVITDNEVPTGIFTEKDVLRRLVNKLDPKKTVIKDVMTSPIRAVREETHIIEAFAKMYKGKYRHLLVRGKRGKIVGIVSMRRILKLAVELGQGMSDTKTVGGIRFSDAVYVDESLSVSDSIDLMLQKEVGAVLVTKGAEPSGIFTERDVLRRVATRQIETKKTAVKEVMTSPLISVPSTELVRDALAEMHRRDIRNMPIRGQHDKLIGIVSMPDILQYAQAFDIDERVRQAWKEVEEYYDSDDQYTPG
jgi:signal-transduction protein with cAMP-binding, CBS, and nucleotidyltransferase domain